MKKQIALVLAGTAASIAGGLRLIQDLVDHGERNRAGNGTTPEQERQAAPAPPEPAASTKDDRPATAGAPAGASKAELYEIATELKISGRSKMSKAELIKAIDNAG